MSLRQLGRWSNICSFYSCSGPSPKSISWLKCIRPILLWLWLPLAANAMTPARIAELRIEAVDMFYHGYDSYMRVAFPDDEVRPLSCIPMTRDRDNPHNTVANDPLGNYSLTLIDSLSTLAVLASAPADRAGTGAKALRDFQDGVSALVMQYGDGTGGRSGKGLRAHGFDLDSKVQVFETVIRGVGGLLSAHLFASGELPIDGYEAKAAFFSGSKKLKTRTIIWPDGFRYNGQLLRLALDLAQRLLPAFYTPTGLPYPRVNLRHGIPFYFNSPLHQSPLPDGSVHEDDAENTETSSAGAGSLVLEFTVLSRLAYDPRFEQVAKRAFWAIWNRRSRIGLLGAGIDAETGHWIGAYSGIGAGIDSFFDNPHLPTPTQKAHMNFLNTASTPDTQADPPSSWLDPNTIYNPLTVEENSSGAFLEVWHESHAAVKRHLYSATHHPHYVNVHLVTGSPQAYWIDALGAFYPGLLTLAGQLEEAIEINLLYTALWTRYSALPERWSVRDGNVEGGLGWWLGRPEFIESNYHLYRATKDPWYLHVGEMVLKDIKQRCWAECGWSGLQDVRSGENNDRMESFFLGETVKYLYLLFDMDHPLHSLDSSWVYSTEGHPLLIPRRENGSDKRRKAPRVRDLPSRGRMQIEDICPAPPEHLPFSISATAARKDIFHASTLVGLNLMSHAGSAKPGESLQLGALEFQKPDHPYFPWTLPDTLIPPNGTCAHPPQKTTFTVEFPVSQSMPPKGSNSMLGPHSIVRLNEGLLVKSLAGLKFGMVLESPAPYLGVDGPLMESWRIWSISSIGLGRDEQIFIPRDVLGNTVDRSFTRVRDSIMLDLILQVESPVEATVNATSIDEVTYISDEGLSDSSINLPFDYETSASIAGIAEEYRTMLNSLVNQMTAALREPTAASFARESDTLPPPAHQFTSLPAITSIGIGAAPLLDVIEAADPNSAPNEASLLWTTFFFAGQACRKIPDEAVRLHNIIVLERGGCTFSEKLANIPSFVPSENGLQLVVVVSDDGSGQGQEEDDGEQRLIRPLLDQEQRTPRGLLRTNLIHMVMVGGGMRTIELLRRAKSLGLRRRYHIETQGLVVGNILIV